MSALYYAVKSKKKGSGVLLYGKEKSSVNGIVLVE
jgi:hypothetical protein